MDKKIKIEVLKNFYNALSIIKVENGKNYRLLLLPDHEEELDEIIAPIAKEVWTDEVKKNYKDFLELEHKKFMEQIKIINE